MKSRHEIEVALERAGASLANFAFQLMDRLTDRITIDDRKTLDAMRRAWDLAHGEWQQKDHLSGTQVPMGCTCGQPRAEGVMHRTSGPCLLNAVVAGMERAGEALHLQAHPTAGATVYTVVSGAAPGEGK